MTSNELRALLRRYVDEVWTHRNPSAVDPFLAPTYCRHVGPLAEPLNRDGQRELVASFQRSFPDAELTIEAMIVEGELIAFRSRMRATHLGEFRGIPATSRKVDVQLIDVIRVADGKFVEQWGGPDLHDLLRQLGAVVSVPDQF